MSKSVFKSIVMLIAFAGLVTLLLTRLDLIALFFKEIFAVLTPFLVGFVLAYILNIPYQFFMNKAFKVFDKSEEKNISKVDEFFLN